MRRFSCSSPRILDGHDALVIADEGRESAFSIVVLPEPVLAGDDEVRTGLDG